jgi:homotetrameric cytidine deaminase
MKESHRALIEAACEARNRSHAPYSGFRVGAALLCGDGRIITGANIENASFGLSICAERSAVCRAVAEGQRDFLMIAICADAVQPTFPCGACRQVLLEFCPHLEVILAGDEGASGEVVLTTLDELLPHAFVDFRDSRVPGPADRKP